MAKKNENQREITKMTITFPLEGQDWIEEEITPEDQLLIDEINLELREGEVEIRRREYEAAERLSKIRIDGFKI